MRTGVPYQATHSSSMAASYLGHLNARRSSPFLWPRASTPQQCTTWRRRCGYAAFSSRSLNLSNHPPPFSVTTSQQSPSHKTTSAMHTQNTLTCATTSLVGSLSKDPFVLSTAWPTTWSPTSHQGIAFCQGEAFYCRTWTACKMKGSVKSRLRTRWWSTC